MKKRISVIVKELGIVTAEEIASILKGVSCEVKKKTLSLKLEEMEGERVIFKILPKENPYEVEGYLAGPNIEAKDDFEIKRLIVELNLSQRDVRSIKWDLFSYRIIDVFLGELKRLREDLETFYDEPKSVEMKYFDLSIKYHELNRFFFDVYNTDVLIPIKALLDGCREYIEKKES